MADLLVSPNEDEREKIGNVVGATKPKSDEDEREKIGNVVSATKPKSDEWNDRDVRRRQPGRRKRDAILERCC